MAEIAATAVTFVVDKLLTFLWEEAKTLGGEHDEVKDITGQLKLFNSFVKDAEEKVEAGTTSKTVKDEWVNQLREVAFRMEDVVDHYSLKVAERNQRHGVYGAVTKGKEKLKSVTHRHDIASQISKIKKTLEGLERTSKTLNLKSNEIAAEVAVTPRCYRRLEAHFVEESQLVGIERSRKVLTDWLHEGERKRSVMVVVGPPGIGKTAIVKNVYNKQKVLSQQKKGLSYFEFCAWITLSWPQVDDHKIISSIIQKIREEDSNASAELGSELTDLLSLLPKVKEYFQGKRYLIVFDDVRELQFWDVIKLAIPPNSSESSRVIITTRNEKVADDIGSDPPVQTYKLEPLSQNDALNLFRQKAFQSKQKEYPELNELSIKFVEKCDGVPLAIVATAGLLSTKKKASTEWKKVLNQLGSLLQRNSHLEIVQQVMLESYKDLPCHLKRCFLYFSLFPQGYSISCMRLIRLWVAAGFVKETDSENTSMEEFAEEYLDELFHRCLVHGSRVDFDGTSKSCYVHNFMHEFISRICEGQMFCQVMKDQITPSNSKFDSVPRRLSIIMTNDNATMERAEKWKKVRSCFVFDDARKWPVTEQLFSSFELLIELDLSNTHLDDLPKQVGNLLNLKYLSLRDTNIKSLPKSIGNLEKLQTLDLKRTQVHELPEEIKKLIKLRHLLAYCIINAINNQLSGLDSLQGVKLKEGLENLTSLQTLSFLDATNASTRTMKELEKLKQLRKLGIIKLKGQLGEALCSAIESMIHLSSLSIGAMKDHEMLQLQSLRNPPESLRRLYLYGRLERLPNWIPKLPNLIRLYLKYSGLKEDPLPQLKDLSALLYLVLYDTYEGDELHFKNGWLKGLKVLCLESLPKLKTIKIDKGALPCLGELKIGKCHGMVHVPSDLKNLTCLQKLNLYDMHQQFINRMVDKQNEDYWIINGIPLVHYSKVDHFATLHNLDS